MSSERALEDLVARVVECRACPRLVAWREGVARDKRAAYAGETYWGRPVPPFGDPAARLLIVGLAPAAHGGNRTGRMFTGDRSGDWLYGSLHRTGFANQPTSRHPDDGLRLDDVYISAAVRCAPPANKPTPEERDACRPYLEQEIALLNRVKVMVPLGGFAWEALLRILDVHPPKPPFGHAVEAVVGPHTLIGCYHPSQQNTFTGRLTEAMLDAVFTRARRLVGS